MLFLQLDSIMNVEVLIGAAQTDSIRNVEVPVGATIANAL